MTRDLHPSLVRLAGLDPDRTQPAPPLPPKWSQTTPPIPPHRHEGYEAVYEVIRSVPGDANRNALIWRAVEAGLAAAEPEHERQVRAKVAAELADPSVWADPLGQWTAEQADAARATKEHIIRYITRDAAVQGETGSQGGAG